jgi:hypothetical protein
MFNARAALFFQMLTRLSPDWGCYLIQLPVSEKTPPLVPEMFSHIFGVPPKCGISTQERKYGPSTPKLKGE